MSDFKKIRDLVERYDIRPTKSLGQNFLSNPLLAEKIVSHLNLSGQDLLVEIGPGTGSLTDFFADSARHSLLIEIDRKLLENLHDKYGQNPKVQILHQDASRLDFSDLTRELLAAWPGAKKDNLKLISNLPYNLTSDLLMQAVTALPGFSEILVTVQAEAADRIMSPCNSKGYGPLPVIAGLLFDLRPVMKVAAHEFYPQPGVLSTVLLLKRKKGPAESFFTDSEDLKNFERFLKYLFGRRRKTLLSSLGDKNSPYCKGDSESKQEALDKIADLLMEKGYSRMARAQEIAPLNLYEIFTISSV